MIGYDWYYISADGGETWTTQYLTAADVEEARHEGYIVKKEESAALGVE